MADVPDKQIKRLRALIQEAETNLAAANELLVSLVGEDESVATSVRNETLGKVIEGVFDGQNMVGSDGKTYPVPANYASKSKLVQGDILKLTIAEDGAFLYKQIGPNPSQASRWHTQARKRPLLRRCQRQTVPRTPRQRNLLQGQAWRPSQRQRPRRRLHRRVGRSRSRSLTYLK